MNKIISTARLEEIKTKINNKKVEKAKAEGAIESIQSVWKKEYALTVQQSRKELTKWKKLNEWQ